MTRYQLAHLRFVAARCSVDLPEMKTPLGQFRLAAALDYLLKILDEELGPTDGGAREL